MIGEYYYIEHSCNPLAAFFSFLFTLTIGLALILAATLLAGLRNSLSLHLLAGAVCAVLLYFMMKLSILAGKIRTVPAAILFILSLTALLAGLRVLVFFGCLYTEIAVPDSRDALLQLCRQIFGNLLALLQNPGLLAGLAGQYWLLILCTALPFLLIPLPAAAVAKRRFLESRNRFMKAHSGHQKLASLNRRTLEELREHLEEGHIQCIYDYLLLPSDTTAGCLNVIFYKIGGKNTGFIEIVALTPAPRQVIEPIMIGSERADELEMYLETGDIQTQLLIN